jgi:hypothetical protein
MAMMERGAQGLCQRIGGVDNARDVREDDLLGSFPFLEGKMLDVDMTGTWCGAICIDHQDCRGVIFEQGGRTKLWVPKLEEDRPKVFSNLGGMDGGKEFGFSGAGGDCRLNLGFVSQGTTAKHKD